jgi:glycine/D-amino acid oxidase-like deaminating enzyme
MMKALILGGGIMGLSAAKALLARGHQVSIFDPAPVPNPDAASWGDTRVYRAAYFESPAYVSLALRAIELWKRWELEADEQFLLPTGVLYMGCPESELLAGVKRASHKQGVRVEKAGSRAKGWNLDPSWEALWEPTGGAVLARRAYEFAARATRGAEIIQDPEGYWDATLFASSRAAQKLAPWLPVRIQPMETHIFESKPGLPETVFACEPGPGRFLYGFPEHPDQGGFKAASHTSSAETPTLPEVEDFLAERLAAGPLAVAATKSCSYDMTPDGHFLFGVIAASQVVMTGFSGHGFKFAPALGEAAADLMEGKPWSDLAFLSPSRFR